MSAFDNIYSANEATDFTRMGSGIKVLDATNDSDSSYSEPVVNVDVPKADMKITTTTASNYEVDSKLRKHEKSDQPAPEQEQIPASTFLNLKDSIFYNIRAGGNDYVDKYVHVQPGSQTPEESSSQAITVHGLNVSPGLDSFPLTTMLAKHFKLIPSNDKYPNVRPSLLWNVFDQINGNRNITTLSQYRALQNATFATEKTITDVLYHAVMHILSYVHNGVNDLKVNNMQDIKVSNAFTEDYTEQLVSSMFSHNCTTLELPKKDYDFPAGKQINEVNHIVSIPADLQKKLWKISKYFHEVKQDLVYNAENGYYCYETEGVKIPVLCTHEYMALNGDPLDQISLKCYLDGKCKYCDQEISAYHNLYNDDLPPIIYSLIIRFIECILDDIDVDALNIALFDNVYAMITRLRKANSAFTDGMITALTAIYLHKIYVTCKDEVNFNSQKIAKYNDSMTKLCSAIGWSGNIINSILGDTKYLPNADIMIPLIKGFTYTTKLKYTETLPLSILFNKNINPSTDYKLEPKTTIQKLFVEGKIEALNVALTKARAKLWDQITIAKVIKAFTAVDINATIERIRLTVVKNGQHFYDTVHKWYCPASECNLHTFTNKECKYCGYKADGSNKQDIYNKYQITINGQCTTKPALEVTGMFSDQRDDPNKAISKYDPKQTFGTFVGLKDSSLIELFNQGFGSKDHLPAILKYINQAMRCNFTSDELTEDTIKRCLSYIIDSKLDSAINVLNELKYIFISIKDSRMLLAIVNRIGKDEKKSADSDISAPLKL